MNRLTKKCVVEGCDNRQHSRGWCRKHYSRWWVHGDPLILKEVHAQSGEPLAFLNAIPSSGTGCLTWPFSTNGAGYAQINVPETRKKQLVSRIVCERTHGSAPTPQHQAAHLCGKGHEACIAPWHLVWKTPADNSKDTDLHGTRLIGEASPVAKMTTEAVRALRQRAGTETHASLARAFGISPANVSLIVNRKAWRHVA